MSLARCTCCIQKGGPVPGKEIVHVRTEHGRLVIYLLPSSSTCECEPVRIWTTSRFHGLVPGVIPGAEATVDIMRCVSCLLIDVIIRLSMKGADMSNNGRIS